MATQVTAKIEVHFDDGAKTLDFEMKQPSALYEENKENKVVMLHCRNEEVYTGYFRGMDGDYDIMLQSLSKKHTIGIRISSVDFYWEEIK